MTTIHQNAIIIKNFIEEFQKTLIESECFDNDYLEENFKEVSIIGLLQLSDGELNEMFEFKSPKFVDLENDYIGYKNWDYDEMMYMTKMSETKSDKIKQMKKYEDMNRAIELLWNKSNLCEDMIGEIASYF